MLCHDLLSAFQFQPQLLIAVADFTTRILGQAHFHFHAQSVPILHCFRFQKTYAADAAIHYILIPFHYTCQITGCEKAHLLCGICHVDHP